MNYSITKQRGGEGDISQGKAPATQTCQPEFNPRKPPKRCEKSDVALWTSCNPSIRMASALLAVEMGESSSSSSQKHACALTEMRTHKACTQRRAHRDMHTQRCAHRGNTSVFKFRETEKHMPSPGSKSSMTVEDQKHEPVDQKTELELTSSPSRL